MKSNDNNDYIHLRGIRLKCNIGVSMRERKKKQVIIVNIGLKCNLHRAGKSDRLKDTVDYSVLAKTITALAAKKSFCLLESLAENIAEICLADSRIQQVIVKAAKTGGLANVSTVEVAITRNRSP